jgi:hypothetical protein
MITARKVVRSNWKMRRQERETMQKALRYFYRLGVLLGCQMSPHGDDWRSFPRQIDATL